MEPLGDDQSPSASAVEALTLERTCRCGATLRGEQELHAGRCRFCWYDSDGLSSPREACD